MEAEADELPGPDGLPVEEIRALARRYGLRELAVFGSFATGRAQEHSDLDLLYVRGDTTPTGWDFLELSEELAALVGRPVDLVPREFLHWVVRDRVLAEARVIYAA